MSADYTRLLDRLLGVFMHVEFKTDRRDVVDYSIVLLVDVDGELETVRSERRLLSLLYTRAQAHNA